MDTTTRSLAALLFMLALGTTACGCGADRPGPAGMVDSGTAPPSEASFDRLVSEMDRHYSYFTLNGIDWDGVTSRHRAAALAASSPDQFVDAIVPMLAELSDPHIWVVKPSSEIVGTVNDNPPVVDYGPLSARMTGIHQIGRVAFTARTPGGYGFAAIGTLQMSDAEASELESSLEGLFDAPGIIVDIRNNAGGNELLGRRFASMFAGDTSTIYAHSQRRNGPGHDDFSEPQPRSLEPRSGARYAGPVVLLTGPRTMSSAEALTLMFRVLPTVTVMGAATRGASGNPEAVELVNGVSVFFSRWKALDENRAPFERVGLVPDAALGADDDVLAAAESMLGR